MYSKTYLTFFCALCSVALLVGCATSHLSSEEVKKYQKEVDVYEQAIRINPDDAVAYRSLGLAYMQLDRKKKAVDAFKQAIRINPNDAVAYMSLGGNYELLSRYQDAIDAYEQSIRINPDNAFVHYRLGWLYKQIGPIVGNQKAIDAYKQAIRIKPDYTEAHFELGLDYSLKYVNNGDKGDKDHALEEYMILRKLNIKKADELFEWITRSDAIHDAMSDVKKSLK